MLRANKTKKLCHISTLGDQLDDLKRHATVMRALFAELEEKAPDGETESAATAGRRAASDSYEIAVALLEFLPPAVLGGPAPTWGEANDWGIALGLGPCENVPPDVMRAEWERNVTEPPNQSERTEAEA